MGTLIYVAILAMWAAYLIPLALRRHDELSESRSVDRFARAMRVLSRRAGPPLEDDFEVRPRRDGVPGDRSTALDALDGVTHRSTLRMGAPGRLLSHLPGTKPASTEGGGWLHGLAARIRPGAVRPAVMARPSGLVARRRQVLVALLTLTALLTMAAVVVPLPWWVPMLGVAAVAGDLLHLFVQARRAHEMHRRHLSSSERVAGRSRRSASAERVAAARLAHDAERSAAQAAEAAEAAERERLAAQEAARLAGWEPVAVTLPTYVTKPMAPSSRIIDLTEPGQRGGGRAPSWYEEVTATYARQGDDTIVLPDAGSTTRSEDLPYDDRAPDAGAQPWLEEIIERRRAVND